MYTIKTFFSWIVVNLISLFSIIQCLAELGILKTLFFCVPILLLVYGFLVYKIDIKSQKSHFIKNSFLFAMSALTAYVLMSSQYQGLMKDISIISFDFLLIAFIWLAIFFIFYSILYFFIKKVIYCE